MNARAIQPLTAAGIAAVLTAATLTGAGIRNADLGAGLRTEFAAVQLQALTVSAAAAVPPAAVTPSVTATVAAAAAAIDPVQMVTEVVKNALSIAAAALWYAAFPITLPLSVIGGLVASLAQNATSGTQASVAASPLQGIGFFFTAPNVLLTTGFANIGLSMNYTQLQLLHFPIGMAAAVRPAAAAKRASTAPAAPAASVRSAKKAAVAVKSGPAASKRAAAARSAR
ncbi:hypothetical protein [Mycolicibacterium sp.]|uniref:hypothetical protein n=1 Tax=Mycolicibacterium sp. TaxID=2320850 RepID=UPI0025FCD3F0|nr:hypothetical protein [Mycolicibacterium sp.]